MSELTIIMITLITINKLTYFSSFATAATSLHSHWTFDSFELLRVDCSNMAAVLCNITALFADCLLLLLPFTTNKIFAYRTGHKSVRVTISILQHQKLGHRAPVCDSVADDTNTLNRSRQRNNNRVAIIILFHQNSDCGLWVASLK